MAPWVPAGTYAYIAYKWILLYILCIYLHIGAYLLYCIEVHNAYICIFFCIYLHIICIFLNICIAYTCTRKNIRIFLHTSTMILLLSFHTVMENIYYTYEVCRYGRGWSPIPYHWQRNMMINTISFISATVTVTASVLQHWVAPAWAGD